MSRSDSDVDLDDSGATIDRQLDILCFRFEQAWRSGEKPRLEDYLAEVKGGSPDVVLTQLIRIEIKMRRRRRETPVASDYVERFAPHSELIKKIFDSLLQEARKLHKPSGPSGSGGLHVRCPHCHNPIELVPDAPLEDIRCHSCGSSFSLVGSSQHTRDADTVTQLGQFQLVERLGMGAFGTVWKARDTQLDRTVAVKVPRKGQLGPEETEKFFREARSAAQLRHPNIVPVYEVGRDGDSLYIVSDFIRGVPLSEMLAESRMTFHETAELLVTVAEALHHAHEAGIIHRDLKPQNIMIDDAGKPHLMDFGLAKREAGEVTMTLDGAVLGTPAYMSPEQALGQSHSADRASDIYSLGVVMFQMLTGELPFRGTPRMLIHKVINDEPQSPRRLDNRIPNDLETITLKCLEKEPGRRYGTAGKVADELGRWLAGIPILARPVNRIEQTWRWGKRNPWAAASLSLVAILVSVLLALGPGAAAREAYLRRQAQRSTIEATRAKEAAERVAHDLKTANAVLTLKDEQLAGRAKELAARSKELAIESSRLLRTTGLADLRAGNTPSGLLRLAKSIKLAEEAADEPSVKLSRATLDANWRPNRIQLSTARFQNRITAIAISNDGEKALVSTDDGQIGEVSTRDGMVSALLQVSGRVRALTFGMGGKSFFWVDDSDQLFVANRGDKAGRVLTQIKKCTALKADPKLKVVYLAVHDESMLAYDIRTGELVERIDWKSTNKDHKTSLRQEYLETLKISYSGVLMHVKPSASASFVELSFYSGLLADSSKPAIQAQLLLDDTRLAVLAIDHSVHLFEVPKITFGRGDVSQSKVRTKHGWRPYEKLYSGAPVRCSRIFMPILTKELQMPWIPEGEDFYFEITPPTKLRCMSAAKLESVFLQSLPSPIEAFAIAENNGVCVTALRSNEVLAWRMPVVVSGVSEAITLMCQIRERYAFADAQIPRLENEGTRGIVVMKIRKPDPSPLPGLQTLDDYQLSKLRKQLDDLGGPPKGMRLELD